MFVLVAIATDGIVVAVITVAVVAIAATRAVVNGTCAKCFFHQHCQCEHDHDTYDDVTYLISCQMTLAYQFATTTEPLAVAR